MPRNLPSLEAGIANKKKIQTYVHTFFFNNKIIPYNLHVWKQKDTLSAWLQIPLHLSHCVWNSLGIFFLQFSKEKMKQKAAKNKKKKNEENKMKKKKNF